MSSQRPFPRPDVPPLPVPVLLERVGLSSDIAVEVVLLQHDSRRIEPGDAFVALQGSAADGHHFLREAQRRGASMAFTERPVADSELPQVVVPDLRQRLGYLAAARYQDVTASLATYAVTGTNGKTTTTWFARQLLGPQAAYIGTIGVYFGAESFANPLTTPEATDLHALCAAWAQRGGRAVVLEASSIALDQGRLNGCHFDGVAFTNITEGEHLDYHGTFEAYLQAKLRLREFLAATGRVVLNGTDRHFAASLEGRAWRDSRGAPPWFAVDALSPEGTDLTIDLGDGPQRVRLPLPGRYNVWNAVLALDMVGSRDISRLATLQAPPGRFEPVVAGQPFGVVVDYAHTPDALENVLRAAHDVSGHPPVVVFGCGGDRDPAKRPLMGRIAQEHARLRILTSDNPRSEDPDRIIAAIQAGCTRQDDGTRIVPDRRGAIHEAMRHAAPGEMVVIAGKGDETVQIIGDQRLPFSDREVALEALAQIGYAP